MTEKQIEKEMGKLYLNGILLKEYVKADVFRRLEWWLGMDLSFELAILSMFILRGNCMSVFCQGTVIDDEDVGEAHAWVEFKKGMRWYVMDLSCGYPYVFLKSEYFSEKGFGRYISMDWQCSFDSFWSLDLTEMFWVLMHFKDTSFVLNELNWLRPTKFDLRYTFDRCIMENHTIGNIKQMKPFFINKRDFKRPISTEIIQDFVKKPKRQQPKMKTIRRAIRNIKQNH